MKKRIKSIYSLKKLRTHLKRGGIIAYPTESCYGIGGLPNSTKAIKKILNIKKRKKDKGMIVIGKNISQLQTLLFRLPETHRQRLYNIYPAPKTVLLPARNKTFALLRGKQHSKLAVRVPQHVVARGLCQIMRTPLISTSCNRRKQRPCKNERSARREFGRNLWVIGGQIGRRKIPSEIIDWENGGKLR